MRLNFLNCDSRVFHVSLCVQSGSLVHLQLVQVHPGLCEIGLSEDENQILIQEQQQLMEKLKVNAQTREETQTSAS